MGQEFCEVENLDPAIHQKWLKKHGFEERPDGTFLVASFEGKQAVDTERLFENIRTNVPNGGYVPLYSVPYDNRIFVMVCGGPSLAEHLDEIRLKTKQPDKYLVVCSNMTAGYLLSHDITPHVHFILDPQEKKRFDVAPGKTSKQTQYWINVACDPAVFLELKSQGITPYVYLAGWDAEGKDVKAVKESIVPGQPGMMVIQGGTMAGLRAINIAEALGHRKMEYYGFDATVRVADGRAQPYAYEKKRGETIIEIACELCSEKFDTTLVFQKQVNEFLSWSQRMPWMDIRIIGGGMIAHCQQHLKEKYAKRPRVPYRYTPEYARLQKELHAGGHYGTTGKQYIPTIFHAISQLAKRLGVVRVLDYGSSSGDTMKAVREHLVVPPGVSDRCYDPFVDEFSKEPEPADLVICTDVMEHVEPECTFAVLDHLASLTKRIIFFSISLQKANKTLSDGRNAHINIRSAEFWLREINSRFIMSEAKIGNDSEVVLAVGQSINDVVEITRRQNERRAA